MLARLAAFWFGIQTVWSAVLGIVLQDRASALAPDPVVAYALLAACGAAFAAAVQLAAGFAADRWRARTGSRRVFYRSGTAIAAVAVIALCAAPSLPALWLATFALQLGMNVANGPYQAIVTDHVEPDRYGRASSWTSAMQFCGSFTGLLLATVWHGALLGTVLALVLASAYAITDRAVATAPRRTIPSVPLRLDGAARTVLGSRALINVGFYTLFGFLFFFVRESLGVAEPRTVTGVLFLSFTAAGVGGAALCARAADRYDQRVVVSVACAAIGAAVVAFACAPSVAVAVACAAAAGAAWGAFLTIDWAIAYAVLPAAAMASAMGVWNLAAAIPQVVAPWVTSPLVAAVDAHAAGAGPRAALLLVVVEFVLGTLWLWRVPAKRLRRVAARMPAPCQ